MADWTAKCTKIEEIARKKDELNHEFMSQTKEALHAKMEHCEVKRDAIITEVKEKLKVHSQEIERTRLSLEQQKIIAIMAIENKLETAEKLRDENMKKTMERLKEHVSAVHCVDYVVTNCVCSPSPPLLASHHV